MSSGIEGMITAKAIMSMKTVTMMKKKAFFPNRLDPGGEGDAAGLAMSGSSFRGPARIRCNSPIRQHTPAIPRRVTQVSNTGLQKSA